MDFLGRLVDATIGRLLRWAGGQYAKGAEAAHRQEEIRSDLLAAMSEATAVANTKLGRGYHIEGNSLDTFAAAEGRVATLLGQLEDDQLAGITREFLASATIILSRNREGPWLETRDGLRDIRDRAAERARVIG
jgi:hypothetical protein